MTSPLPHEQVCLVNFNNLTTGWYCNVTVAGAEANITVDPEFSFVARRDIARGEELTVRYAQFSTAA